MRPPVASVRQVLMKETQPVGREDRVEILIGISARSQNGAEFLKIGDGIHTNWHLLGAEAAVEVAADGHMFAVSRKLADVVDVIGARVEVDDFTSGLADHPAG